MSRVSVRAPLRGPAFWLAVGLSIAVVAGCARKLPPPGGNRNLRAASVGVTRPDSGAVLVPRWGALELEFTERMNERVTDDWILIAPFARSSKIEWKGGKVLRYVLAESLRADQTYAFVLARGARDERGNVLTRPTISRFTTGPAFPPGALRGRVDARGHEARDVYVWAYREDLGHAPDSTARDFDALGVVETEDRFEILGLPVPSRWRLYAFHDANGTLTFEPGTDHLTEYPEVLDLTEETTAIDTLRVLSLDPAAPGRLRGRIIAGEISPSAPLRLHLASVPLEGEPQVFDSPVSAGDFEVPLDPGQYRMWLYLDLNRNGTFEDGEEPASERLEGVLTPGLLIEDIELRAPGSGEGSGS